MIWEYTFLAGRPALISRLLPFQWLTCAASRLFKAWDRTWKSAELYQTVNWAVGTLTYISPRNRTAAKLKPQNEQRTLRHPFGFALLSVLCGSFANSAVKSLRPIQLT